MVVRGDASRPCTSFAVRGRLRVPNPLDKHIAATALLYGLIVVTRNDSHYVDTGVAVLNPFF